MDRTTSFRCTARLAGALLISLTWIGTAIAGDVSLLINGKAIHIDPAPGTNYNEKNWGIGFQYDFKPTEGQWIPFVTASEFRDSNKNVSYYAGGGFMRRYDFFSGNVHIDAGGVAFLMVRKDFRDGDPFPGLLPVLSVGAGRYAVNMTYIPRVDPKMVPIVYLQLKITLGEL